MAILGALLDSGSEASLVIGATELLMINTLAVADSMDRGAASAC